MKKFAIKFIDAVSGKTREQVVIAKSEQKVRKAQAGQPRSLISIVLL